MVYATEKDKLRDQKIDTILELKAKKLSINTISQTVHSAWQFVADVCEGKYGRPEKVDATPLMEMFDRGVAVSAIAKQMGITYQAALFQLKETGREREAKKKNRLVCKHSDSCFLCPLPDCAVSDYIIDINRLDTDAEGD